MNVYAKDGQRVILTTGPSIGSPDAPESQTVRACWHSLTGARTPVRRTRVALPSALRSGQSQPFLVSSMLWNQSEESEVTLVSTAYHLGRTDSVLPL